MTVSSTTTSVRYEGNGSTDTFAFAGRIFSTADLVVEIVTRATDVLEETLTITTDYTVTINGDESASVEVTNASKVPSATQDIQIRRNLTKSQTVDLPTGTVFPAKSVEDALDKNVAIIQEQSSDLDRAIKLPVTSSLSGIELPNAVASEIIGWNATADDLTTYEASDFTGPTGAKGDTGDIGDISAQTTGTPATGDFLVWADIDDSNNTKKSTIANTIGTSGAINAQTSATISATDEILFGDVGDSNNIKKDTVQGILDLVTASGMGVLLGSYTASNDTSVDIGDGLDLDAVIDGTYDEYELHVISAVPAVDNRDLFLRTSTDGGSSFDSTANDYAYSIVYSDADGTPSGASTYNSVTATEILLINDAGSTSGESCNAVVKIYNPASSSLKTLIGINSVSDDGEGSIRNFTGSAGRMAAEDVDAVRLLFSSGNIESGTFYLYGLKKS